LQVPEHSLPLHETGLISLRAVANREERNAAKSPRARIIFMAVSKRFIVGKLLSWLLAERRFRSLFF